MVNVATIESPDFRTRAYGSACFCRVRGKPHKHRPLARMTAGQKQQKLLQTVLTQENGETDNT